MVFGDSPLVFILKNPAWGEEKINEPAKGLEPPTHALQKHCSTN